MKQHPVYLSLIATAGLFLLFSNLRGWSLLHTMHPGRWFGGGAGSSFAHK
jgi:hypothetical protein